jgi:hypothetical protein
LSQKINLITTDVRWLWRMIGPKKFKNARS